MLALIFVPMGRKKLDPIAFAGGFIDLPPTDVRHMNPIALSHPKGAANVLTHSNAITRI
jgi:hypothetical protein